jgi:hypothetical protein
MPLGVIAQFAHGGALTADNLNAPVNDLKTKVDAFVDSVPTTYFATADMVSAATANKGVKRDANAGAAFGPLTSNQFTATAKDNTVSAGAFRGATGDPSQTIFAVTNNAGTVNHFYVFSDGNGVFRAGVAATLFTGSGSGLTGIPITALADYKATPGASGLIAVAAGGSYRDSNGATIPAAIAATAALPTQPTGTHTRYVAITKAPTTGALTVTSGVDDDTLANLVVPLVNKPICVVLLRGATTNPGYVIAANDIFDIRFSDNAGGAGGGGSGVPTATAVLTSGDYTGGGTPVPNSKDVTNASTNLAIHSALIRPLTTDAALSDAWQAGVGSNLIGSISASGGRIVVNPNAGAIFVTLNNRPRRISSAITATNDLTGNGAGAYKVVLDISGVGPAPALFTTQGLPGTNQYWVANVWWTGTAFDFTYVDYSPAFPQYNPPLLIGQPFWTGSVAISNTTPAVVSGTPTKSINLPCAMSYGRMEGKVWVSQPATVGGGYIDIDIDGTTIQLYTTTDGLRASAVGTLPLVGWVGPIAPGAHTFDLRAYATNGAQPYTITGFDYSVELFR